ncbi:TPA: MobQ family relaxase [Pseudomonas aeruginosa]
MAIAHCSVKTVSRSGGRSATAAAAYRTAEQVADQRTGEVHDYRRRGGVEHVAMLLPAGAPAMTTSELWSAAELAEKRKNSTVAREVEVALPHELPPFERHALAERITQRLVERYQVAAQVAVHTPDQDGDQRNHHAHILCTTRAMDASGQLGAKTRQLDDLKTGPQEVLWIRQMVELETNQALARAGIDARIDMRSLADQGIEREPTTHEGPRVTAIRRECEQEQRGPLGACDVIELNDARRLPPLATLRAEAQQLEAQIIDLDQHRQERALRREIGALEQALGGPEPRYVAQVKAQKRQVEQTMQAAKQWHQEHPIRSTLCRWFGVTPTADLRAEAARQAFNDSEARRMAQQWLQERAQARQRLQEARQGLLATPGVAEAAERLENASRALRRAEGLHENHATRAVLDERNALHQERTAHQELRREIEAARQRIPTRAEAQELEQRAGQQLERMERWEQIEQQRQAATRQAELERLFRRDAPAPGNTPNQGGPKLG